MCRRSSFHTAQGPGATTEGWVALLRTSQSQAALDCHKLWGCCTGGCKATSSLALQITLAHSRQTPLTPWQDQTRRHLNKQTCLKRSDGLISLRDTVVVDLGLYGAGLGAIYRQPGPHPQVQKGQRTHAAASRQEVAMQLQGAHTLQRWPREGDSASVPQAQLRLLALELHGSRSCCQLTGNDAHAAAGGGAL